MKNRIILTRAPQRNPQKRETTAIRRWSFTIFFLSYFLFNNTLLYARTELDNLSGPQSLLAVFETLGIKSDLDEIKKLSGYDEVKGTTLNGLSKAAEAKGLSALQIKMDFKELSKLKMPVIIYLWDDSFKAINRFDQDKVEVINSDKESIWISKIFLNNVYSGLALLISNDKKNFPESETRGPDIKFDEYVYHFGIVKGWEMEDKKLEHIFKFKNMGSKELVISRVRSSCGCTAAILSDKKIAPGGEGEIKASFNIVGRIGNQSTSVRVFSNDPTTPIVTLQIKAVIRENKIQIIPPIVNFGDVNRKFLSPIKVNLISPEGGEFDIIKIESSSKYVSTVVSENKEGDLKGFELEINISPNIPISELNEKVIIYTSSKEYSEIAIPVKGNIKGDIELRPSKFFFGLAGEMRESKIVISNTGTKPLTIEKIENPLGFVSVEIITDIEGKKYTLIANLRENTPPLNIKGNIIVYTSDPEQSKIEIPVYCLASASDTMYKK